MTWRIGQSWASKKDAALWTIVEQGTGPLDGQGHRPDDRLVGCAKPEDAERIVRAVNAFEYGS